VGHWHWLALVILEMGSWELIVQNGLKLEFSLSQAFQVASITCPNHQSLATL
jgi:hypothetical protein